MNARPAPDPSRARPVHGYTLVELLLVMALCGLVSAWALPSFDGFLQRRRIEGLSIQFVNDLQWLKIQAQARGESLRLGLPATGGSGGYLIHSGAAGACQCEGSTPRCSGGARLLRGVCLGALPAGLQLRGNVASMLVDARQATFTPTGSIEVSSPSGGTLRHIINIMGRTRRCAAQGQFAGVPAC